MQSDDFWRTSCRIYWWTNWVSRINASSDVLCVQLLNPCQKYHRRSFWISTWRNSWRESLGNTCKEAWDYRGHDEVFRKSSIERRAGFSIQFSENFLLLLMVSKYSTKEFICVLSFLSECLFSIWEQQFGSDSTNCLFVLWPTMDGPL